ncbi:MAG: hypothetical protein WKF37_03305 [Bryobacteraceae bacterium]
MNVPRDVVLDLLPVYLSGEASQATRELVRTYAETDPEIKAMLDNSDWSLPPVHTPKPERKMETLKMTKDLLLLRSWMIGFAVFFTLLPFSFVYTGHINWWMIRDAPKSATVYALLAAVFWIVYLWIRRRVRITGL